MTGKSESFTGSVLLRLENCSEEDTGLNLTSKGARYLQGVLEPSNDYKDQVTWLAFFRATRSRFYWEPDAPSREQPSDCCFSVPGVVLSCRAHTAAPAPPGASQLRGDPAAEELRCLVLAAFACECFGFPERKHAGTWFVPFLASYSQPLRATFPEVSEGAGVLRRSRGLHRQRRCCQSLVHTSGAWKGHDVQL